MTVNSARNPSGGNGGELPPVPLPRSAADFTSQSPSNSRIGTVEEDGQEIANPTGQYLDSFNTQLVAG